MFVEQAVSLGAHNNDLFSHMQNPGAFGSSKTDGSAKKPN